MTISLEVLVLSDIRPFRNLAFNFHHLVLEIEQHRVTISDTHCLFCMLRRAQQGSLFCNRAHLSSKLLHRVTLNASPRRLLLLLVMIFSFDRMN